ncbi:hypothetical protein [Marinimicrobium agarilyticum]|uniref:hypothetical protein n=1 Tax=Marinimicrobium agarilyticum TaxID=306546 RepID=UPI0004064E8F|nr:hypothetical protein [Marinimicrobium agarilyticum]
MTQVGEGVAAGAGKDPKGFELDDNHWLELDYLYQNGTPLYGTYRATDSEGMEWNGRLNDQGQVCLAGLPDGKVQVDLLPETSNEKALEATRQAIQEVLDQIIADQKAEAEEYERDLENLGGPRRVYQHIHKVGDSVWNAALGVVELAETATHKLIEISNFLHPVNLLGDQFKAAYKSYQDGELTREQWYDSINQNLKEEHQKDLARIFGIEPDDLSKERLKELMALIAEAYDIAAFIVDDDKTQAMLKQFVKEMAATQHSMEWAGFAGAVVFELVLAALLAVFTGGIGTAAQASTKLHHTAEMRKLAPLFRKLSEQLKNKKLNKQLEVPVDTPTTTKTDQPDIIELKSKVPNESNRSRKAEAASGLDDIFQKIPESDYLAIKGRSVHNVESETLVLGKYRPTVENGVEDWSIPGPDSYVAIAKRDAATYFDLGGEWESVTSEYGLSDDEMFRAFNIPVLDDTVRSGKQIKFTHDPRMNGGFLQQEWEYLQSTYGYKRLKEIDGVWYAK